MCSPADAPYIASAVVIGSAQTIDAHLIGFIVFSTMPALMCSTTTTHEHTYVNNEEKQAEKIIKISSKHTDTTPSPR